MKKRKFKKKLTLKKHTISNLKQNDLSKVYGGAGRTSRPCDVPVFMPGKVTRHLCH